MFVLGLVLIVATVISLIYSFSQTPDHLSGYYGAFYTLISLGAFIGGVALIIFSFLP